MDVWVWVIFGIAIVLVAGIALLGIEIPARRKRDASLRSDFGPEYDRAVDELGGERKARKELERRRERVDKLKLRPIPAETRQRLQDDWMQNQADFVDEPEKAFDRAATLVDHAMDARGYPVGEDFDRRYQDLSVEYGYVLNNYRDAREVTVARTEGEDVGTEDLRRAMICYRALFNELLNNGVEAPVAQSARQRAAS